MGKQEKTRRRYWEVKGVLRLLPDDPSWGEVCWSLVTEAGWSAEEAEDRLTGAIAEGYASCGLVPGGKDDGLRWAIAWTGRPDTEGDDR